MNGSIKYDIRQVLMQATHCLLDKEPKLSTEDKTFAAIALMSFVRESDELIRQIEAREFEEMSRGAAAA